MNTQSHSAAKGIWLALMLTLITAPMAQAANRYLSGVSVTPESDGVTLVLNLPQSDSYQVTGLAQGIQISLPNTYLNPAKQHIPIQHPQLKEVFAYQFNANTVRVRLLAKGISGQALRDSIELNASDGRLSVVVSGLEVATKPAVIDIAPELATLPVVAQQAEVAEPIVVVQDNPIEESATPQVVVAAPATEIVVAEVVAEEGDGVRVSLDTARSQALAVFEKIVQDNAPQGAGEPALMVQLVAPQRDGAGMPSLGIISGPGLALHETGAGAPVETQAIAQQTEISAVAAEPVGTEKPQGQPVAAEVVERADPVVKSTATAPKLTVLPTLNHVGSSAPSLMQSGIKMAAGLLVVLALMMGALAVLKRFKGSALGGRVSMRVLGSVALGSRQSVMVIEVDGRRLVVGVGPGGTTRLADLDGDDLPKVKNSQDDDARPSGVADPETVSTPSSGHNVPQNLAKTGISPFAQALQNADDKSAGELLNRTTRNLKRHIQLLRSKSV